MAEKGHAPFKTSLMVTITGYYFTAKYVIYSSLIGQDRFASIHDRTGLTDEQAMHRFKVEHSREVKALIIQKVNNENNTGKANDCRIIRTA